MNTSTTLRMTAFVTFATFTVSLLQAQSSAAEKTEAPPWAVLKPAPDQQPLPQSQRLSDTSDLSAKMIAGIDQFLLKQIAQAAAERPQNWNRDLSSPEAYTKSIAKQQQELSAMLGLTDPLVAGRISYIGDTPTQTANGFTIYEVSWPVLDDLNGAGLLLVPEGKIRGDIIAVPEADQVPEDLVSAKNPADAYTQQLVRSGFRVLIPTLINREDNQWKMSNREWAHRPAFELGRTLAGYETQKIMAGVSILKQTSGDENRPVGVIGWGEGGRLALYAAALDPRIDSAAVCGYFGPRQLLWEEPADRNVFGL
ncbi:MAG: dienelactone hydrolase family protein, partial [Planctomycetaceae bacterium]|nr:dienelactone hydrolase family protein [Planctomycetaceae bacterium]